MCKMLEHQEKALGAAGVPCTMHSVPRSRLPVLRGARTFAGQTGIKHLQNVT